ncbi:MAG: hypothetical protein JWM99_1700 [Verrucomicrobiales bacterium]|nr:hypothetical protein [Verrucomicrobiales bacterium]
MKAARANRIPPNAALISLRALRLNPPEDSKFRLLKFCVHHVWDAKSIRDSSNYPVMPDPRVTNMPLFLEFSGDSNINQFVNNRWILGDNF